MHAVFGGLYRPVLFFLLSFLLTIQAQAQEQEEPEPADNNESSDWVVTPELSVSFRNFEYSADTTDIDGDIFSLRFGASVAYKNYYLDITGETNLGSGDTNITDVDFDRQDATLTFGYGLSETISIFLGYKHGETTIQAPADVVGSKITLTGNGFFAGAGGVWPVKDLGAFSFSAAFAVMDASYNQPPTFGKTSGDATGTSLSLAWNGVINRHFLYHVTIHRHDYFYEDFGEQLTFDISENVLSLSTGISYRF
ncbi:MAG: hypothetical protein AAF512_11375 [Pseudomonadota bacterium]